MKDPSISGSQARQDKNMEDKLKKQRTMAYQALKEQWTCKIHSTSSQKVQCWPDPVKAGYCRPLTKANLGYRAMLHVSDLERYPIDVKPREVNALANQPLSRLQKASQTPVATAQEQMQMGGPNGQPSFPYGFYPPPPFTPGQWYQPPPAAGSAMFSPYGIQNPPMASALAQHQIQPMVAHPNIAEWLRYCDKHPQRSGDNLSAHIPKFEDQGYRRINQITRATIEQLSDWLNIGKVSQTS